MELIMPTVKVRNLKNEEVGEVELSDAVFDAPLNEALIHAAVRNFMANARQGTSATKTRGDVSGAGRKLWKQKGTGRARIGSVRSPLWRHGGTVHGPHPRAYDLKINKKERQEALRIALSQKVRDEGLWVLDTLTLEAPKTRELASKLKGLGLEKKVLLVDEKGNSSLKLASRNLERVHCTYLDTLNAYDVMKYAKVLFSREAVGKITEVLG
jgi:large subunit ribosomal protein L4